MTDNGKWLNRDLKSVLAKVREDFSHKWPHQDSRDLRIESWSDVLSDNNIKPDTIIQASWYCINHLDNNPSLYEFREFCKFLQSGSDKT